MPSQTAPNSTQLIAATFTPMQPDGRLDLDRLPGMVDRLIGEGVTGLFACGGTGEGFSLTAAERKAVAEAHVRAAAGRVPVIVQVGHNSLFEAQDLAAHAAAIGADAIAAMAPTYTKPNSLETLIQCLKTITAGAPALPFIYYHFPQKSGLTLDVAALLERAGDELPSLAGVKFTDAQLVDLQACREVRGGHYRIYFGWDEMLLNGLGAGAQGAIGSTYNFAAPLYRRLISAFECGEYAAALREQAQAARMVRVILAHGGLAAQKAVMTLIDSDCGPIRWPNASLSADAIQRLGLALEAIGFFAWARGEAA